MTRTQDADGGIQILRHRGQPAHLESVLVFAFYSPLRYSVQMAKAVLWSPSICFPGDYASEVTPTTERTDSKRFRPFVPNRRQIAHFERLRDDGDRICRKSDVTDSRHAFPVGELIEPL